MWAIGEPGSRCTWHCGGLSCLKSRRMSDRPAARTTAEPGSIAAGIYNGSQGWLSRAGRQEARDDTVWGYRSPSSDPAPVAFRAELISRGSCFARITVEGRPEVP